MELQVSNFSSDRLLVILGNRELGILESNWDALSACGTGDEREEALGKGCDGICTLSCLSEAREVLFQKFDRFLNKFNEHLHKGGYRSAQESLSP